MKPIRYNNWLISSEPNGYAKFECQHKDYDGEGDNRIFHAQTLDECRITIDERNSEYRAKLEHAVLNKLHGVNVEELSIDELFELS